MAVQKPRNAPQPEQHHEGIARITVGGFKSIAEEQSIEIRPLTILAGANSSGKSSIMQPLLLLKQTLDATYDPGALLLNGPNVRFTLADQLLARINGRRHSNLFSIAIENNSDTSISTHFVRNEKKGFAVERTVYRVSEKEYDFYLGMPQEDINAIVFPKKRNQESSFLLDMGGGISLLLRLNRNISLTQARCFLTLAINIREDSLHKSNTVVNIPMPGESRLTELIRKIIHLPGLRGNPERTYPVTAVGPEFPGTFETYVASIIGQWQSEAKNDKLRKVNNDLFRLGLARQVSVRSIDDTQVELRVNRFPHSSKNDSEDMVSIADVGLGVSQTLPVVVAIHAAEPDQLIYLEQPEIHLHPRAQSAMAEVLADAAIAGKRLVVETHSSLLLLGIQTLVAEGKLPPELVKLHWFTMQEDGSTKITSADLDETGAFGDWPEDFATVTLESEDRYLDAAQKSLKGN